MSFPRPQRERRGKEEEISALESQPTRSHEAVFFERGHDSCTPQKHIENWREIYWEAVRGMLTGKDADRPRVALPFS